MRYRDLIPGRLGGRYIASHITIPNGGPVDDWVHYHAVAFQMIFVAKGWVRVVYEDQGDPFVMEAGDLVLQPPYIRHRVLESSSGLEVVEVGCPALHRTFADHDMSLPNGSKEKRRFFGQRFLRHICSQSPWTYFGGGEAQETGMSEATQGLADVRVMRGGPFDFQRHEGELVFGFVLSGSSKLGLLDGFELGPADAFVVPLGEPWGITGNSVDFRMLLVSTGIMPAQIPGEST
jgi:quercetin dioxygenase-like cupin family protein